MPLGFRRYAHTIEIRRQWLEVVGVVVVSFGIAHVDMLPNYPVRRAFNIESRSGAVARPPVQVNFIGLGSDSRQVVWCEMGPARPIIVRSISHSEGSYRCKDYCFHYSFHQFPFHMCRLPGKAVSSPSWALQICYFFAMGSAPSRFDYHAQYAGLGGRGRKEAGELPA